MFPEAVANQQKSGQRPTTACYHRNRIAFKVSIDYRAPAESATLEAAEPEAAEPEAR
jgi:hypothetical protein